jgi:amidase
VTFAGKVNLHELACGASGINPWFGTPRNPLDPRIVPGGSSSGSAVAVACGEADVAFGSDTAGSVRIPSACCGTAGLKTTHGRISLSGVFPLAPSLDTVGPMATTVAGLVTGMALLEPGFVAATAAAPAIGRLRGLAGVDPVVDAAIDDALARTELEIVDVFLPGWDEAATQAVTLLLYEAGRNNEQLLTGGAEGVSADLCAILTMGRGLSGTALTAARTYRRQWCAELSEAFRRTPVIAAPVLTGLPPSLDEADRMVGMLCTAPVNLAGIPALAQPVPTRQRLPASVQLIAGAGEEGLLLATGLLVEQAVS